VIKSGREIIEILEAYDPTGCVQSAAQLAGTRSRASQCEVARPTPGRRCVAAPEAFSGAVPF
jgi:hypothetical protein